MKTAPRGRAILSVLALLAVSVLPAGAQPKAPRTLAFVVGIEHYDDGDLDKIQFAADDARQVYTRDAALEGSLKSHEDSRDKNGSTTHTTMDCGDRIVRGIRPPARGPTCGVVSRRVASAGLRV
jgi:hypothetical protein